MVEPQPLETTPDPDDWCRPLDRSRQLRASIGLEQADPLDVWERGYTITAKEYHWRLGLSEWAVRHAPEQPEANPRRPADLGAIPSLF